MKFKVVYRGAEVFFEVSAVLVSFLLAASPAMLDLASKV